MKEEEREKNRERRRVLEREGREREREKEMQKKGHIHISVYTYTHVHIHVFVSFTNACKNKKILHGRYIRRYIDSENSRGSLSNLLIRETFEQKIAAEQVSEEVNLFLD